MSKEGNNNILPKEEEKEESSFSSVIKKNNLVFEEKDVSFMKLYCHLSEKKEIILMIWVQLLL
jgi:hypothetical protein